MLQLKEITKNYITGSLTVEALKGISVAFGENEFISILGQSGCGKTTLLNIIGGLDQYTSGDLIIDGKSTKEFTDRDWDSYRNHSIGFVFQSYNLIPHQTVLQNVELALSLSGVSKSQRRKRAKEVLESVGLGNQFNKKPGELSGGQMQRVAIARALVNNPKIILADEPTGALDSETSIQVMDLLKDISKERLVIMVTHNPEIAEKYSTRIIRMIDGVITSDSSPVSFDDIEKEAPKNVDSENLNKKRKTIERKPSMSFPTSFLLSLKNLITKKSRTILTSFAGSIGIIGIALIFAVSQGMSTYIDTVQEETLSSYPLTLEETHVDISTLLGTFLGNSTSEINHQNDAVYQKAVFYEIINSLNSAETNENDLKSFKEFIDAELKKEDSSLKSAINGIQYNYSMDMLVYTENIDGSIIQSDTKALMQELLIEYFGMDLSSMVDMRENYGMGNMMNSSAVLWQEMLSGENGKLINDVLEKQYDVIYGSWPTEYNEVVIVVDENNEIDDMALYALGLKSKQDIDALANAVFEQMNIEVDEQSWSYDEICNMNFKVVFASDCYTFDESTATYTDLRNTQAGLKYLYDNGTDIKVSGIIRPTEDALATMLTGSIGYTSKLTEYIIEKSLDSPAIKAQLTNTSTDIFTGLPFHDNTGNLTDEEKIQEFEKYVNRLDQSGKAETYIKILSIPTEEQIANATSKNISSMSREDMNTTMANALSKEMGMSHEEIFEYINSMSDEDITKLFEEMVIEQFKNQYAAKVKEQIGKSPISQLAFAFDNLISSLTNEQIVKYHDEVLEFSQSSYEDNLLTLGYVNLNSPSAINIFASSFENKDTIEAIISEYNSSRPELEKIVYTDYVGLMMSSITKIINAITYVLVAFVAISLIVSSIMIGVITLISVQERTKEIGILRAIGASKKNISSMFNAETIIIGFTSGVLGITITYILCIPINIILHILTGIGNLNVILPIPIAIILITISVLLTLFAGIIPSRSSAKKDPVVALRTE